METEASLLPVPRLTVSKRERCQLAFAPKFGLERLFQFQKAVESALGVFNVSWRRWRYGRSPQSGAAPPFLPPGEDGAYIRRGEWSAYYMGRI